MTSQPTETAREDVANALQILTADDHERTRGPKVIYLNDYAVLLARLRSALVKLDAATPALSPKGD